MKWTTGAEAHDWQAVAKKDNLNVIQVGWEGAGAEGGRGVAGDGVARGLAWWGRRDGWVWWLFGAESSCLQAWVVRGFSRNRVSAAGPWLTRRAACCLALPLAGGDAAAGAGGADHPPRAAEHPEKGGAHARHQRCARPGQLCS